MARHVSLELNETGEFYDVVGPLSVRVIPGRTPNSLRKALDNIGFCWARAVLDLDVLIGSL